MSVLQDRESARSMIFQHRTTRRGLEMTSNSGRRCGSGWSRKGDSQIRPLTQDEFGMLGKRIGVNLAQYNFGGPGHQIYNIQMTEKCYSGVRVTSCSTDAHATPPISKFPRSVNTHLSYLLILLYLHLESQKWSGRFHFIQRQGKRHFRIPTRQNAMTNSYQRVRSHKLLFFFQLKHSPSRNRHCGIHGIAIDGIGPMRCICMSGW